MMNNDDPKYAMTCTGMTIHRKDDNPIFGESAISLTLEDDGSGCFLKIRTNLEENLNESGVVSVDKDEIPIFINALSFMYNIIDELEKNEKELKEKRIDKYFDKS